MSVPVIAFFNNKGGVGKTFLVYHLSHMLANLDFRVVATDLDPQGNLSAAFLDEEQLELLWPTDRRAKTIWGAVSPVKRGVGDIEEPTLEKAADRLALIAGDMSLSEYEDDLSEVWPKRLDKDERAFRVTSAFWRVMQKGAARHNANVIMVDLGPNLGAINRAALIGSDSVIIPLGPDLFSLQGLQNLGPTLHRWRKAWSERLKKNPVPGLDLPQGAMNPIGYIVMQHSVRQDRPVKSYERWIGRIPGAYRECVLRQSGEGAPRVQEDEHCLALLKHYRSLMPMARESRKPMFALKPADGALGAHTYAVRDAYGDFENLAREVVRRAGVHWPSAANPDAAG